MSKRIDRIKSLISAVQIEDIRLVDVSAITRVRSPKDVESITLHVNKSATASERHEDGTFFVTAIIDTQLITEKTKNKPIVAIKAGFELRYKVPQGFIASKNDLNIFASINSIYNVWPYWREFIQNIFTRMNLPPVILPLFRVADQIPQINSQKRQSRANN